MKAFEPVEFGLFLLNNQEFSGENILKDIQTLTQLLMIRTCCTDRRPQENQLRAFFEQLPLFLRLKQKDRMKEILRTDKIQLKQNGKLLLEF